MSRFLEREARKLIKDSSKNSANTGLVKTYIAASQALRRAFGEIPLPVNAKSSRTEIRPEVQRVYPEISLSAEHRRQARILAKHFAARLKMTEKEYIAALPPFPEKLDSYDSLGITVPLIAQGKRISWIEQASISNVEIDDYLKERAQEVKDWEEDPFKFVTPQDAFTTWIQDGTRFVNREPRDVRSELTEDLRIGGIEEIISAVNLRPDIVKGKGWDLPRSCVGSGHVACLCWFGARPGLDARFDDRANPDFRSLVCGRKIGT